jgi:soluble lytic murein transglycosylase-like protein
VTTVPDREDKSVNHRIRQGETLWSLASRHGLSLGELTAANPRIANPHMVEVGQEVHIPGAPAKERHEPGRNAMFLSQSSMARTADAPAQLEPAVRRWWPMICEEAQRAGVDPKLLAALVQAESKGDPGAVSWAGARGLTQLMPETAREVGVTHVSDPRQSLRGGATYLKQQLDRFGGDTRLALAAYNAGAGNVDYYGGVPPFLETQAYVRKVMDTYKS